MEAQPVEVGEVNLAVLDHNALALADGDRGPLPARLAVVPHLQTADDHVVDALRGEREAAHAHFDAEPARLAAHADVERLVFGVEVERLGDHVGETLADGGQLPEVLVRVDRVRPDHLERVVVVQEDLGDPAAGLVGVGTLEAGVGEKLVAQADLPHAAQGVREGLLESRLLLADVA